MIERVRKLVSIRSVSGDEGPMADAATSELESAGIAVHRSGHNIWCEIGDRPQPRLLLNSHLDTVPPGDGWTGDPWTPRESDGRIVGLGANDAKGCVAAMMEAALRTQRRLDRGESVGGTVVLALTAEEETTGREGLATILDRVRPLDGALVGEPTNLTPMTAQRGLMILRCEARGRSSHPANTPPDSPTNAIRIAASDISRLGEFDWGEEHPLLGRCHCHPTMVSGGVARNVVPDRCEFFLDIRTTPLESHAQLLGRLREFLGSRVHVHSDRLVPVETAERELIVRAVLRAIPGARPTGSAAMSDMVFLRGVPTVKVGPGDSARSHTADEFVHHHELEAGAAAYERIISAFFALSTERATTTARREGAS